MCVKWECGVESRRTAALESPGMVWQESSLPSPTLELPSQVRLVGVGRPLVAKDSLQPGWFLFQPWPLAALEVCPVLCQVQDPVKVSCAIGELKTTLWALPGSVITDHCLGVLAGLFQGRKREGAWELWDSD